MTGCRPVERDVLDPANWSAAATESAELLALWADTTEAHALWRRDAAVRLVSVPATDGFPALSPVRPGAVLFERAIHDLYGHVAIGAVDLRPWLDHGAWEIAAPLGPRPRPRPSARVEFPFRPVDGASILSVGPVRAGLQGGGQGALGGPARLRVSGSGDVVAGLETRLGYGHVGVGMLMRGKTPRAAARFAARLTAAGTVAHSIAFARAAEAATGTEAPRRAQVLRGIAAEIERAAVHLVDIDALAAADAPEALLLRETLLRAAEAAFGHRLMMDAVVPGGMAADLMPAGLAAIGAAVEAVGAALPEFARRVERSARLAARTVGCGVLSLAAVAEMAAGGVVGRASGRVLDLREWPGSPPYDEVRPRVTSLVAGDVDARLRLRLAETAEALRLLPLLRAALPDGPVAVPLPMAGGEGIGWAEGARGDVWHWLRLDGGVIGSMFARDPAWLQWPLFETAMQDGAIGDLTLIERSLGGGSSGMDI